MNRRQHTSWDELLTLSPRDRIARIEEEQRQDELDRRAHVNATIPSHIQQMNAEYYYAGREGRWLDAERIASALQVCGWKKGS